ncbi:MAG: L,D-transpeptidase [Methylococcaceae bacterium]
MNSHTFIDICLHKQQLTLIENQQVIKTYLVSTAKNGAGELRGSECTPRGWHCIRARIGEHQPLYSVFVGRRPTGEIYNSRLREQFPQRDWILTRILWLGGLEAGKNRYGKVDSAWRYIYIHGAPDELMSATPQSHGCIRMNNADVLDLFERVPAGMKVFIHE